MDELYLDNIDEYVNDHDKIRLRAPASSLTSVNSDTFTTGRMLYHYLDHKRKESSAQLHATYLVSGKFVDNGQASHKVSVVREEQLEDFKAKMSLIVSVHVYSVQKALLKDSGPLYSVDYDAVESTKSKPAVKSNPVMNFFGTQATKKPDKTVKEEEPAQSSSSAEQRHASSQPEEKQEAAAVGPKDTKKDSRSKTKRIEDSDSEEEKMEKKKRRRIKKPEPDSSDEDVIPDSPQQVETREPSPPRPKKEVESVSHPGSSEMKVRKRRRVLKSRTFVDDEGCIVTEKGYESESYSETEDDAPPTKQAPKHPFPAKQPTSNKEDVKKSQKKAAANASKGTKQASIMGFFQKK
eukprot:superscaffoldBa00003237_g16452